MSGRVEVGEAEGDARAEADGDAAEHLPGVALVISVLEAAGAGLGGADSLRQLLLRETGFLAEPLDQSGDLHMEARGLEFGLPNGVVAHAVSVKNLKGV